MPSAPATGKNIAICAGPTMDNEIIRELFAMTVHACEKLGRDADFAEVLREKSVDVTMVTDELRKLADDMIETMHAAKGVGLAAQQVGRTERMCVIDIPEGCDDEEFERFNAPIRMPLKLFNPRIVAQEGSICDKEGCLSFPGVGGSLTRAAQVTAQYLDENNLQDLRYIHLKKEIY